MLLSHKCLKLLLVEAGRQAELRHHGISLLLHLRLSARWRLWLRLLLLRHLDSLLHLVLLTQHVELLWVRLLKLKNAPLCDWSKPDMIAADRGAVLAIDV